MCFQTSTKKDIAFTSLLILPKSISKSNVKRALRQPNQDCCYYQLMLLDEIRMKNS